ncbi:hypothetical protein QP938_12405 [Porticoccaceae bacterium LTM1]|nr:hypothetical protein QP938_12405 [Porticoccaceae bacterium LTM1]
MKCRLAVFFVVSMMMTGCALVERQESTLKARIYKGAPGFEYYLGYHRLVEEVRRRGISEWEVVVLLMEKELGRQGVCPNGYKVINTLRTENVDYLVYGECI